MRKLASIREVASVEPIEGADRIEKVRVDGWTVVAKKGELSPGEKCVFFEVDSLLPVRPEYEFLRKCCYVTDKKSVNGEGFRLKTTKLRGVLSQGLALPVPDELAELPVGTDVTERLGVKLYEQPVPASLGGVALGMFPSYIPKTDLERAQNIWDEIESVHGRREWEITLKLDGASMTVFIDGNDRLHVCSKNVDLAYSNTSIYWQVADKLDLRRAVEELNKFTGHQVALQGELVGPGIQKNRGGYPEHEFRLYGIWDITEQKYFAPDAVRRMVTWRTTRINLVPIIRRATFDSLVDAGYMNDVSLESLLDFASIAENPDGSPGEGFVFKSLDDDGHMIAFKAISNKYLLRE